MSGVFRASRCVSGVALLCATPLLWAAEEADRQSNSLETVLVMGRAVKDSSTALPFNVSVAETPFSVQSVTSELLRDQMTTSLADALRNIPGVQPNKVSVGRPDYNLIIRGFPSNAFGNYRDGLRVSSFGSFPVEAYERIDVLLGPSALQTGFSNIGGVVNYVTKRPGPNPFFRVLVGGNDEGGVLTQLDANQPLTDRLGVRLAGGFETLDNYIDGFHGKRYSALASSDWSANTTRLHVDAMYYAQNNPSQPAIYYYSTPTSLPEYQRSNFFGQTWNAYDTQSRMITASLEQDLSSSWTFSLKGNYERFSRSGNEFSINDPDPITGDATAVSYFDSKPQRERFASSEARFSGKIETGRISHQLSLGYSLSTVRYCLDDCRDGVRQSGVAVGSEYETVNLFNPVRLPYPNQVNFDPPRPDFGYYRYSDPSFYLVDRIDLASSWTLWAGAKHLTTRFHGYATGGGLSASLKDFSESATVPIGAVVYTPAPALHLYASFTRGLEEGGSAPLGALNYGQQLPTGRTRQEEVGAKYQLGQALFSAALFEIERPREYLNSGNYYVQNGLQRHRGLEFSVSGSPTERWTVVGGFQLLNAKGVNVGDPTINGRTPVGVVERSANLYTEYRIAPRANLALTANLSIEGRAPLLPDESYYIPGYGMLSLGARYGFDVSGRALTLRALVNNVTDKYYWQTDTYQGLSAGAPRTYRVSVEAEF